MRKVLLGSIVLLAACHTNPPIVAPAAPAPSGAFTDLLGLAGTEDSSLDFEALRLAYTATDAYDPYGMRDDTRRREFFGAIDQGKLSLALAWADSLLGDNPVDPEGHAAAGYVAESLDDSVRASHHRWMAHGLMSSILASGSGSEAAPFVVIAVYEEYEVARYLGFKRPRSQALGSCARRPCDFVTFVVPQTGRDTTLHFDISVPMQYLERAYDKP